ncbi:MAG: MFS transporter [Oligoflexia bacterium]|nr:MFS transporter [Oligoflexia bacterium]
MKEKYSFEILSKNLRVSIWDGVFYSLMVGLGETYFQAFAIASGFSALLAGLLSTIPLIGGSILQLCTPLFVDYFGSYKKWVVVAVSLQGLCFIPLAIAGLVGGFHPIVIFILITLYWSFGMSAGPVWNAWLHSLLPSSIRMGFFAKRNALNYLATFAGILLTGLLLEKGKAMGLAGTKAFTIIFILSAVFRFAGVYCLSRQSEKSNSVPFEEMENSCRDVRSKIRPSRKFREIVLFFKHVFNLTTKEKFGKILCFVLFFKMAVYFSAPFFTPFMLVQLKFSYWIYMLVLSASFLGRVFIMRFMRKLSTFFGVYNFLLLSSFGICFIPFMWTIFASSILCLFVVEIFSGMLWGIFDLSVFIIAFNDIEEKEQAKVLSIFNFIHNILMVLSSCFGGLILSYFGSSFNGYIYVFLISSFLRLLSLKAFPEILISTKNITVKLKTMRGFRKIDFKC